MQPQAQAFQAQRDDMDRLVDEMKSLGIAIRRTDHTNQSGVSKRWTGLIATAFGGRQ